MAEFDWTEDFERSLGDLFRVYLFVSRLLQSRYDHVYSFVMRWKEKVGNNVKECTFTHVFRIANYSSFLLLSVLYL